MRVTTGTVVDGRGIDPEKSADFTWVRLEVDRDDRVRSPELGGMNPFHMGAAKLVKADEDAVSRFRVHEEGASSSGP